MFDLLFISSAHCTQELLAKEMEELGVSDVHIGHYGVFVPKTMDNVYLVNYLSRLANRVLWPIAQFSCRHKEDLYQESRTVNWDAFLTLQKTFAIDANASHPNLRNSLFAAQVLKDAICDHFREKYEERPSVDTKKPDVQLHLFIHKGRASISLDTSGAPLYKRGWKQECGMATIPETLAATLLKLSGFTAKEILCDPFCGAGTLLVEAACIATNTPAGYFRKEWGFLSHPDFDQKRWLETKKNWDAKRISCSSICAIGADKDPGMVTLSQKHLQKTGFSKQVIVCKSEVAHFKPSCLPTLIITDPPFGKRMMQSNDVIACFNQFLKVHCLATPFAHVLYPSDKGAQLERNGMRILKRWPLSHGGLDVSLFRVQHTL
ncbi:MAG: THUMP domain-containing protein [Chlamydiales bacterium]|jgi:putative N6-adenine-specific DNA methylase|nr:THUMP domain-containing protein [Chlamydiales bacterium]